MIRIALVEDDPAYAEQLLSYLKEYEKESKERISVQTFSDGEDIVTEYRADYDIILMDVEMKFMDGMSAAEEIRKMDTEVVIIFITNMPQYAIQGYRVDALDYVLKPVSYFAFTQRIDRALTRLKKREKKYLTIAVKGGMMKLDLSEICYVEVVVVKHFCNTLFENSPGISSFKWCFPIIVGMRTDMIVPYVHISV